MMLKTKIKLAIKLARKAPRQTLELEGRKGFLNPESTWMFVPKQKVLLREIKKLEELREYDVPQLLYHEPSDNHCVGSLYSGGKLKDLMDLVKGYDNVRVKVNNEYPLWVETEDFFVILAPRQEQYGGDF